MNLSELKIKIQFCKLPRLAPTKSEAEKSQGGAADQGISGNQGNCTRNLSGCLFPGEGVSEQSPVPGSMGECPLLDTQGKRRECRVVSSRWEGRKDRLPANTPLESKGTRPGAQKRFSFYPLAKARRAMPPTDFQGGSALPASPAVQTAVQGGAGIRRDSAPRA